MKNQNGFYQKQILKINVGRKVI